MVNTSALESRGRGSNPVQGNFQSFICVHLFLYFTGFSSFVVHVGMRIYMSLKVHIMPTLKLIFVQAVLNTVLYQMLIVYTNVLVNSAVLFKQ